MNSYEPFHRFGFGNALSNEANEANCANDVGAQAEPAAPVIVWKEEQVGTSLLSGGTPLLSGISITPKPFLQQFRTAASNSSKVVIVFNNDCKIDHGDVSLLCKLIQCFQGKIVCFVPDICCMNVTTVALACHELHARPYSFFCNTSNHSVAPLIFAEIALMRGDKPTVLTTLKYSNGQWVSIVDKPEEKLMLPD